MSVLTTILERGQHIIEEISFRCKALTRSKRHLHYEGRVLRDVTILVTKRERFACGKLTIGGDRECTSQYTLRFNGEERGKGFLTAVLQ